MFRSYIPCNWILHLLTYVDSRGLACILLQWPVYLISSIYILHIFWYSGNKLLFIMTNFSKLLGYNPSRYMNNYFSYFLTMHVGKRTYSMVSKLILFQRYSWAHWGNIYTCQLYLFASFILSKSSIFTISQMIINFSGKYYIFTFYSLYSVLIIAFTIRNFYYLGIVTI